MKFFYYAVKSEEAELFHESMLFRKLELVPVTASDAKLIYLSVAHNIPASMKHTGV